MKRFSFFLIPILVSAIVLLLFVPVSVQAGNVQDSQKIFLPLVTKNWSTQPIWVKNPVNLPPANGWPGWSGISDEYIIDCQGPCYLYMIIEKPYYWILEGTTADAYPVGWLGQESGCYGILVTQPYIWTGGDKHIYLPTGKAIETLMEVPDFSQAPPLEWVAQLREKVISDIQGCTNPDIALYYKP